MGEACENILKTILLLKLKKDRISAADIAEEMGETDVSGETALLKKEGYITVDRSGSIDFTMQGKEKASEIWERYRVLTEFYMQTACVDKKTAGEEACKVEHIVGEEVFQGIKTYLKIR